MRKTTWLGVALLALPAAAHAAVYKCTDASGRSIYQDQACAGATGTSVRANGADAAAAPAPTPTPRSDDASTAGTSAAGGAANPSEAWDNLLAAMRSGSIDQAVACFLPSARKNYEDAFRQIGPAGLRETAAQMGEFALKPARGEVAYADVIRTPREGEPKSFQVAFAREPTSGKWFVKSM